MLQINKDSRQTHGESVRLGASSLAESIKSFTEIVLRQLPVFLIVIPCATTLGLLYLLTTPSSYTAVARMVLDSRSAACRRHYQRGAKGRKSPRQVGQSSRAFVALHDNSLENVGRILLFVIISKSRGNRSIFDQGKSQWPVTRPTPARSPCCGKSRPYSIILYACGARCVV